ncbi:MAG TPA: hypothetical protein VGO52_16825 [Hyphomonadaceae bacterium]|jgi:hypothetical protein|nr:hypothetical protein [Hyphomonadaceae bacterium]
MSSGASTALRIDHFRPLVGRIWTTNPKGSPGVLCIRKRRSRYKGRAADAARREIYLLTTSTTTSEKASAKTPSDLEQVMEHLSAIREDFASLAKSTGKLAAGQAKTQARRVGDIADGAAETASDYRDLLVEKIKDRPLAAVGLAVLAGLVLSSLSKR